MSYRERTIAVVVPCYNEESQIDMVIQTMPTFVDKIVVVDDLSKDSSVSKVKACQKITPNRIELICHNENQGVGGAIATGYIWAMNNKMEITAVMAGDGQMDPNELAKMLDPIVDDIADYAKGNRLFAKDAWNQIPRYRFIGNAILSMFTKVASGYWHIVDTQSGYTAISLDALDTLDLDSIYKRYGVPNDILTKLNVFNYRVVDVPIRPVYNVGEKSDINITKVVFSISWLLIRLFIYRMWHKYALRDFHPLLFFYTLSAILIPAGLVISSQIMVNNVSWMGEPLPNRLADGWIIFATLCLISGFQFMLFAMWFDMAHNRHLCIFNPHGRAKTSKIIKDDTANNPGVHEQKTFSQPKADTNNQRD